jgi:hypothetical protein
MDAWTNPNIADKTPPTKTADRQTRNSGAQQLSSRASRATNTNFLHATMAPRESHVRGADPAPLRVNMSAKQGNTIDDAKIRGMSDPFSPTFGEHASSPSGARSEKP